MYVRNVFMAILFRLVNGDKLVGKAWRYRIDWHETNTDKAVKWFKDGKLVDVWNSFLFYFYTLGINVEGFFSHHVLIIN